MGKYRDSKYNWGNAPLKFHKFYYSIIWLQFWWYAIKEVFYVAIAFIGVAIFAVEKDIQGVLAAIILGILVGGHIAIWYIYAKNLGEFNEIAYKILWINYGLNTVINCAAIVNRYLTKGIISVPPIISIIWGIFILKYYYDRKDLFYTNKVFFDKLKEYENK